MNVERLRLINEGTSSQSQINDFLLTNLPNSLEDLFSFLGNFRDPLN